MIAQMALDYGISPAGLLETPLRILGEMICLHNARDDEERAEAEEARREDVRDGLRDALKAKGF